MKPHSVARCRCPRMPPSTRRFATRWIGMAPRPETRLTLRPGQPGTRKLHARFGERLVCVRYLYDPARQLRLKTVELVVEALPWRPKDRKPRRKAEDLVRVRIHWNETLMRSRALAQGARWLPGPKLWEMTWKAARKIGLSDRVSGSRDNAVTRALSVGK